MEAIFSTHLSLSVCSVNFALLHHLGERGFSMILEVSSPSKQLIFPRKTNTGLKNAVYRSQQISV